MRENTQLDVFLWFANLAWYGKPAFLTGQTRPAVFCMSAFFSNRDAVRCLLVSSSNRITPVLEEATVLRGTLVEAGVSTVRAVTAGTGNNSLEDFLEATVSHIL